MTNGLLMPLQGFAVLLGALAGANLAALLVARRCDRASA